MKIHNSFAAARIRWNPLLRKEIRMEYRHLRRLDLQRQEAKYAINSGVRLISAAQEGQR